MGLFDYVTCSGPEFVCSEGHDLSDEEFQTKDLGCTMGQAVIEDGRITMRDGGWGDAEVPGLTDYIEVYCTCRRCPAFVQDKTANLCGMPVDFEVTVVDDVVTEVKRTSEATKEWLESEPKKKWMENCLGPMSYEEAYRIHVDGIGAWTRQKWGKQP